MTANRSNTRVKGTSLRAIVNLAIPAVLLVIAALAVIDGLRVVTTGRPGDAQSGWFVVALGVCLAFFVIISSQWREIRESFSSPSRHGADVEAGTKAANTEADAGQGQRNPYLRQVLLALGLIIIWALALPWLGFAISSALFLASFMMLVGRRKVMTSILLALIISAVTAYGFSAMGVFLPRGIFGI
ncbi:tripartite tricarboxylate transporter TctB family protein [Pseudarthrobacter phenanthrenivorans]|uniref:tripartite tricarboxylate transporter TctB family protein n=1 Tax=Pseudarthrobacter phenanthrenivorans TaxID=361575 RepID=UPI001126318D|nr:tripartite tricarboxylate transporter TctB family protein [Pseudarthrobacter phenanthrenivorans]TPV51106.1 tripartite tricarboxylate transporter TctB family protein [Pseudarthrobacter phenanthrenivorans]